MIMWKKAAVKLDNVILTGIGEYLPWLKSVLGKSAIGKVYREMHVPTPQEIKQAGMHQFQDLIKKYPPNPPVVSSKVGSGHSSSPVYRRDNRTSESGDPHA